jgi:hypothetical protein
MGGAQLPRFVVIDGDPVKYAAPIAMMGPGMVADRETKIVYGFGTTHAPFAAELLNSGRMTPADYFGEAMTETEHEQLAEVEAAIEDGVAE